MMEREGLDALLGALLSGKKQLVVKSVDDPVTRYDGSGGWRVCHDYTHTFSLKDSPKLKEKSHEQG